MGFSVLHVMHEQVEQKILTNSELKNISELGDILKQIRHRIQSEGLDIERERKRIFKVK